MASVKGIDELIQNEKELSQGYMQISNQISDSTNIMRHWITMFPEDMEDITTNMSHVLNKMGDAIFNLSDDSEQFIYHLMTLKPVEQIFKIKREQGQIDSAQKKAASLLLRSALKETFTLRFRALEKLSEDLKIISQFGLKFASRINNFEDTSEEPYEDYQFTENILEEFFTRMNVLDKDTNQPGTLTDLSRPLTVDTNNHNQFNNVDVNSSNRHKSVESSNWSSDAGKTPHNQTIGNVNLKNKTPQREEDYDDTMELYNDTMEDIQLQPSSKNASPKTWDVSSNRRSTGGVNKENSAKSTPQEFIPFTPEAPPRSSRPSPNQLNNPNESSPFPFNSPERNQAQLENYRNPSSTEQAIPTPPSRKGSALDQQNNILLSSRKGSGADKLQNYEFNQFYNVSDTPSGDARRVNQTKISPLAPSPKQQELPSTTENIVAPNRKESNVSQPISLKEFEKSVAEKAYFRKLSKESLGFDEYSPLPPPRTEVPIQATTKHILDTSKPMNVNNNVINSSIETKNKSGENPTEYKFSRRSSSIIESSQDSLTKRNMEGVEYQFDCGDLVKAKDHYQASRKDELSISTGQTLQISVIYDDGWAVGKNMETGKRGFFPLDLVQKHEDSFQGIDIVPIPTVTANAPPAIPSKPTPLAPPHSQQKQLQNAHAHQGRRGDHTKSVYFAFDPRNNATMNYSSPQRLGDETMMDSGPINDAVIHNHSQIISALSRKVSYPPKDSSSIEPLGLSSSKNIPQLQSFHSTTNGNTFANTNTNEQQQQYKSQIRTSFNEPPSLNQPQTTSQSPQMPYQQQQHDRIPSNQSSNIYDQQQLLQNYKPSSFTAEKTNTYPAHHTPSGSVGAPTPGGQMRRLELMFKTPPQHVPDPNTFASQPLVQPDALLASGKITKKEYDQMKLRFKPNQN